MRPAASSGRNRRCTSHLWYQAAFIAWLATRATRSSTWGAPKVTTPDWVALPL